MSSLELFLQRVFPGDLPYLRRYFRNIGVGRERIRFVLMLTPQVATEQHGIPAERD
jgi:hypothetical protein